MFAIPALGVQPVELAAFMVRLPAVIAVACHSPIQLVPLVRDAIFAAARPAIGLRSCGPTEHYQCAQQYSKYLALAEHGAQHSGLPGSTENPLGGFE
jgi:hypothetical protein